MKIRTRYTHTHFSLQNKGRIAQIPREYKASLTIEAAFAVPFFLYAVMCLVLLLEIHALNNRMQQAISYAAVSAAHEATITPIPILFRLHSEILNHVGKENLERSIVFHSGHGLDTSGSVLTRGNHEVKAIARYKIQLPIPFYDHLTINRVVKAHVKAWTGLDTKDISPEDLEMVYITDTGLVYHEQYSCSYLQLSIRYIDANQLDSERNIDGGTYSRCDRCGSSGFQGGVYVTGWGSKYHSSIGCSGLKRTIQVVPKSQVVLRGGCSRCSS